MARSADLAFGNIARQLGFVPKERLKVAMPTAHQRGMSLEQYLVEAGDLNPAQWGQVIQVRVRFGRGCTSCGQTTYLMGAVPPCEHCGGRLQLQPGDDSHVRGHFSQSERVPRQAPRGPAVGPAASPGGYAAPSGQPTPPPQAPGRVPTAAIPRPGPGARRASDRLPAQPAAGGPPPHAAAAPNAGAHPPAPPPRPAQPPARPAQPPPRPLRPGPAQPAPAAADPLAERTLTGEPMEFAEELVEERLPGEPSGASIGRPKPEGEPEPDADDDLAFDGGDDLKEARDKAKAVREERDFREKESGHFSFKTFSFNTSQLKIDTNELWDTGGSEAPKAPKPVKPAGTDDFFAELAEEVVAQRIEERSSETKPTAPEVDSSKFKITGTRPVARPSEKLEKVVSTVLVAPAVASPARKRLLGVAAVLAVGACVLFFPVDLFGTRYEWLRQRREAATTAKATRRCLVEYTTDPKLRSCKLFDEQVLGSDEVSELREEFVWYKEVINTSLMPETIKYTPPYVFVYSPDGKTVLAGSRSAGGLSAEEFRALLLDAQTKAR